MFTDLRGFTSFSESLTPAQVIEVLDHYLSEMSDAILDNGGTLVAYMGDGIIRRVRSAARAARSRRPGAADGPGDAREPPAALQRVDPRRRASATASGWGSGSTAAG